MASDSGPKGETTKTGSPEKWEHHQGGRNNQPNQQGPSTWKVPHPSL